MFTLSLSKSLALKKKEETCCLLTKKISQPRLQLHTNKKVFPQETAFQKQIAHKKPVFKFPGEILFTYILYL